MSDDVLMHGVPCLSFLRRVLVFVIRKLLMEQFSYTSLQYPFRQNGPSLCWLQDMYAILPATAS
jgi:hypothetical protein